jgi:hypothetical protein
MSKAVIRRAMVFALVGAALSTASAGLFGPVASGAQSRGQPAQHCAPPDDGTTEAPHLYCQIEEGQRRVATLRAGSRLFDRERVAETVPLDRDR